MANLYMGEVPIEIGGESLTLRYSWDSIARIRSELGDEGQREAQGGNPEKLSILVAIGLAERHPDWTAERVRAASPPLQPTVLKVEEAMVAAIFGPDGLPKDASANPRMPPQTPSRRLWRRLFGRG